MKTPYNKPFLTGNEINYIMEAVNSGKISGNGMYTKKCHQFLMDKYNFKKVLLTTSCTDALEMTALLLNIQPGDEVIMPTYTFVSTANAFELRGAKIVFADSKINHPNIDEEKIEELITSKTKAIIVVHYSGVACEMNKIMSLAKKYNLFVVEDAAQSIDSYYNGKPLGSIGDLGTLSFHETKNIQCGEGGLLIINNEDFFKRSEIIWEKGTNRSAFQRGEVNKYEWVDIGSSFLPSELNAAFLYAQLENIENIQKKRQEIWNIYFNRLQILEKDKYVKLPEIPDYATNNGHIFYLICRSEQERNELIKYMHEKGILLVFHYLQLHKSPKYQTKHDSRKLQNAIVFEQRLIRLPLYYELDRDILDTICDLIIEFYSKT